ncbi:hypothetical protein AB6A40_003825 [Gnathostoma spinigerum]|uniref:Integrase catalytic domain-containing protein n=1 Tax=Gnathostoma spinigerum TaxID=75299 RepID=A0ABD6ED38_9BILA
MVHIDFAGPFQGSKWFVLMDTKSHFPIVYDMSTDTTAANVIRKLEEIFDAVGPCTEIVSDNGPPFSSNEMKQFFRRYGIIHRPIALYHLESNRMAERLVRSFKEAMKKELEGRENKKEALRKFLRAYR